MPRASLCMFSFDKHSKFIDLTRHFIRNFFLKGGDSAIAIRIEISQTYMWWFQRKWVNNCKSMFRKLFELYLIYIYRCNSEPKLQIVPYLVIHYSTNSWHRSIDQTFLFWQRPLFLFFWQRARIRKGMDWLYMIVATT